MNVTVRRARNVVILELAGKILGGTESDCLRERLDEVLSAGEGRVLVNLEAVPWMNSAGLGILLSGYSRMQDRGGAMAFCGVQERVRGILRTTKLLTVLDILDDEKAGVERLGNEGASVSP